MANYAAPWSQPTVLALRRSAPAQNSFVKARATAEIISSALLRIRRSGVKVAETAGPTGREGSCLSS